MHRGRGVLEFLPLFVLLLTSGASYRAPANAPPTSSTPSGIWHGRGMTTRVASIGATTNGLPLVDLQIRYDSDFWFSVSSDGAVTGTATVHYHLGLDDNRLRGIAAYMNNATTSVVGGLSPILGTVLAGGQLKDIIGMRAEYDGGDPVHTGRINGLLRNGTLHLAWAEEPSRLAYTVYRVYLRKDEVQSKSSGPAYAPWTHDAVVSEWAPGQWQAIVPDAQAMTTRDNAHVTSTWHAERDSLAGR